MSAIQHLQVFQSMNSSPNARLERCAELGDGLSAAIWSNHHDARDYLSPNHHTLSCYLDGGTGTFAAALPAPRARRTSCASCRPTRSPPGSSTATSAWRTSTSARSASPWAAYNCSTASRANCTCASTFLDDPQQAARFRRLVRMDWSEPAERLLTSSLAHAMIDHALLTQVGRRDGLRLKGGLAPALRRRVQEYIDQHLAEPLALGELAALAALSEYHFARMFRSSFGMPPHQYLLARRLEQACRLLRGSHLPLGEIARLRLLQRQSLRQPLPRRPGRHAGRVPRGLPRLGERSGRPRTQADMLRARISKTSATGTGRR
jgi:AraC family transcriptional regulator